MKQSLSNMAVYIDETNDWGIAFPDTCYTYVDYTVKKICQLFNWLPEMTLSVFYNGLK